MKSRVVLLRRLAWSEWGDDAKILRAAALSLEYSTSEYHAPVWYRSPLTRLIDSGVFSDFMHIATECLSAFHTVAYAEICRGESKSEK